MTRTSRLVAGLVAIAVALGAPLAVASSAHAAGVPYTDPKVKGYVGLCDKNGNEVTSGSITDRPFVWRAVSSEPAVAPYDGKGRTAALYSIQPRTGVEAGFWSGDVLTGSAKYTNPKHPMAAATEIDEPLSTNLDTYPAEWDGYYQLRIYLGLPNAPSYSETYAATDIQVTGTTWKVVRGGKADCASGTAVSNETVLLGSKTTPKPSAAADDKGAATPGSGASASASATATAAAAAGTDAATPSAAADVASDSSSSDDSSSAPLVVALLLVAAAVIGGGAYFWTRRRGAPGSGPVEVAP